jgi:NAD-dependent deacetylase
MAEPSASTKFGIRCATEIIRGSKKGVVLSGAGISTASGIPDFRSPDSGMWEHVNPMDVASLLAFRYQPENFYNWMRPLAIKIHQAQPNPAHLGLARLQQAGYIRSIVTQNIDGLHQRAGSEDVMEVHGSLQTLTCIGCYRQVPAGDYIEPYLEHGQMPRCSACGKLLKPDLVLFGEQLPVRTWLKAQEACKECDLMIVAGSSLEVLPAAGLPMRALENGAHLIIINQSHTYLDVRADVVFHENLAEIVPWLIDSIFDGL